VDVFDFSKGRLGNEENLIRSAEELDKAIDHIVQLIRDACTLYFTGSFSSSAFLSITACEEVAKAHVGSFTDGSHPEKGGNFLREHKKKHAMAASPTVPMGQRLQDALGATELKRIMNMAHNAGLLESREDAIYFQRKNDVLVVPSEKVDKNLSRSLALFAIEAFDDAIVGMTRHSSEVDTITDELFEKVRNT
jgi:AbiV family abortive infection protein